MEREYEGFMAGLFLCYRMEEKKKLDLRSKEPYSRKKQCQSQDTKRVLRLPRWYPHCACHGRTELGIMSKAIHCYLL